MENLENVVSARTGAGRSALDAPTSTNGTGAWAWASMVVGSVAPLSVMDGGGPSAIMYLLLEHGRMLQSA